MPETGSISEEIKFVSGLKQLVSTYEEIAVMRIERVRKGVLAARFFREGLSGVFSEVKDSHAREIAKELERKEKSQIDRPLAVLFSSNTRLAGAITSRVTGAFVKHLDSHQDADIVIVGQVGKEQFQSARPNKPITFFSLKEGQPSLDDISALAKHLQQYRSVIIFFGQFENLIDQKPAFVDMGSEGMSLEKESGGSDKDSLERVYIYEPSLKRVINFFDDQITAVLLQLTASESWLSLLGSRITAMEQANANIGKQLKRLLWEDKRQQRRIDNQKQRERLTGISLWNK